MSKRHGNMGGQRNLPRSPAVKARPLTGRAARRNGRTCLCKCELCLLGACVYCLLPEEHNDGEGDIA
jgi:hypothetical protein